jgi:hypothetical protein
VREQVKAQVDVVSVARRSVKILDVGCHESYVDAPPRVRPVGLGEWHAQQLDCFVERHRLDTRPVRTQLTHHRVIPAQLDSWVPDVEHPVVRVHRGSQADAESGPPGGG